MPLLNTIKRLYLIIRTLRKKPAGFKEINAILERESDLFGMELTVSKRTFDRDCKDILTLFNIEIMYDSKLKAYCIENDDTTNFSESLFENFEILNALSISESIRKFVHLEKRKPLGTQHIFGLLHAIQNSFRIEIVYQKFYKEAQSERTLEPYFLKEFKSRWYLIAKDVYDGNIKTYALDRIVYVYITGKKFTPQKNINIATHFQHSFGIITPLNEPPQQVELSFTAEQGKYIKSLPLHPSQQILIDNEEEVRVQLQIHITFDFEMELLSYGNQVKVLKPLSLVKRIKDSYNNALALYN